MSASFPAMRVGDLGAADWSRRLSGRGAGVRVGPFDVLLRVGPTELHAHLQRLYADHPFLTGPRVYSCHARLRAAWHLGRPPARRVRFSVDGLAPHEDMPRGQGLAVLEWGLNLAIAMRFHGFLMLHAAVLERRGRALLMPAEPGSGKTTLAAALAMRGWRLFSDEFGLVRPGGTLLTPVPRPLPLKNDSIAVLGEYAPEAVRGPVIPNTRKGTIVHLKPPRDSVARANEPAPVRWIVFPRWRAGAELAIEELDPVDAFMGVATNAFNYELLGEAGFDSVRALVQAGRAYRLTYSKLPECVAALTRLADEDDLGDPDVVANAGER